MLKVAVNLPGNLIPLMLPHLLVLDFGLTGCPWIEKGTEETKVGDGDITCYESIVRTTGERQTSSRK